MLHVTCVTCAVYVIRSLCDATDAAVSGTYGVPPSFSLYGLFSLNLYIILYILRSLWVQEHTDVVSLCLFYTSGLFICGFHVLSLFAFDMSEFGGKKCCVWLFTVGFWAAGDRLLWWDCLTSFPHSGLPVESVTMGDLVSVMRKYRHTPLPFLVLSVYCIYMQSVMIKFQCEPKSWYLWPCPHRPTSTSTSQVSLWLDVAVLSTSSRGQDLTS